MQLQNSSYWCSCCFRAVSPAFPWPGCRGYAWPRLLFPSPVQLLNWRNRSDWLPEAVILPQRRLAAKGLISQTQSMLVCPAWKVPCLYTASRATCILSATFPLASLFMALIHSSLSYYLSTSELAMDLSSPLPGMQGSAVIPTVKMGTAAESNRGFVYTAKLNPWQGGSC